MIREIHNHQNVRDLLYSIEPGKLPKEVFNEVARVTVTPVIELIVIVSGKILLTRRPLDDVYWPHKYAIPGMIIASGAFDILEQYVASLKASHGVVGDSSFCNNWLFSTKRGVELAIVYRIEVDTIQSRKNYILVEPKNLDKYDIISEHRTILKKCL